MRGLHADSRAAKRFASAFALWLEANIPREWKSMGATESPAPRGLRAPARVAGASSTRAGFIGVTWPKEYGGQG